MKIYTEVSREEYKAALTTQRKIHKNRQHLKFCHECTNKKLLPKFTFIPKTVIIKGKLSPKRIVEIRNQKLQESLQNNQCKLELAENEQNILYTELKPKFASDRTFKKFKNQITIQIMNAEKRNDQKRDQKLFKLKKLKNFNPATIKIFNESKKTLPPQVEKALSLGLDIGVGGHPDRIKIMREMENLYRHWESFAQLQRLSPYQILDCKAKLLVEYGNLIKCHTDDKNVKLLKDFFNKNNDIILTEVDKTKDLEVLDKKDYEKKLNDMFGDTNYFKKLDRNPVSDDFKSLKNITNNLKTYISRKTYNLIRPLEQLRRGYGVIKRHKNSHPIRPIVSSIGAMTQGAEDWLKRIIQPFVEKCTYSVSSVKEFKNLFIQHQSLYDPNLYEIVSFDAVGMFNNINTKRFLDDIIPKIYEKPSEFFDTEEIRDGEKCTFQYPPQKLFRRYFKNILHDFSAFSTLTGYFKQTRGLTMGSKVSGAVANCFMNMLEEKIITKHIKNGNIKFYSRYVDDTYCFIKKSATSLILEEMNNYEKGLEFTIEKISSEGLPFLDTTTYVDDSNVPQLKQYRKPTASDVVFNFNSNICPKKYKISTLVGEIHRANNTCTTESDLNTALKNLTNIFSKNGYPIKLINKKINEIKKCNYQPSSKKH